MRPRPAPVVAVWVAAGVAAGVLGGCGSGDGGRDTQRFCDEIASNVDAIVAPTLTGEEDVDATLDLYRELAGMAPIAIEEEWRDLLLNVETASTVAPDDPESMQRAVAVAYATERSAVAVRTWVLDNCGVDLGPVATIAPQDPAATTTLPPDVATSLVTIAPAPTTTAATGATTDAVTGATTAVTSAVTTTSTAGG